MNPNKTLDGTFACYVARQIPWSARTFGPGPAVLRITRHIEMEVSEIRADPRSLEEWIDVVILALDGAWRAGYTPAQIEAALKRKQDLNFVRKWPPASDTDLDYPIEHEEE